jgi:hypothetical protein
LANRKADDVPVRISEKSDAGRKIEPTTTVDDVADSYSRPGFLPFDLDCGQLIFGYGVLDVSYPHRAQCA